ncbi:putative structural maintenance of chromosome domain-containing protein [Neospora caninum Liverpool]|uniref:Putative structural maintenance of chromosome domain-containing protein n=1 Tax=Neospora caninum (strain Liverpool) TaxID=572307 RepID=F0VB55_NEOCL|nr:putative structural maintenance of chromosome domain-containing protein [Neospora caninum Liverpool]CBZ51392.1 putative structural maintenance of chromosome domain-containing protein [Neospora caninum Liverpool]CEL68712.1 TPA: structural maintenance of chromosome domain-containing protein, putative [Neospora caninum Liverpool]|eukprot:XP_003881425.1 putative structural maintenance of chromosome domain-containing protein [Neospora caninum Liverpool]
MYIKEVTIRGFRTYRHSTTIRFSPGYNCIVGTNGSGKSNVLLAIAFALGEGGHSSAERRMLLHEGVNERVPDGSVEVLLSNADRRLCMYDADEVQIRRVFSATTDDSFVQGKRVSKSGLQQLLECAGFARGRAGPAASIASTSTAYFIQQGRIVQIALQSAAERLALIQHVAGGASFDTKTREIETLIRVGATEAGRIETQVKEIGEKLAEMASERRELKECVHLEEQKEKIDYVLAEVAWREASSCLETHARSCAEQMTRIEALEERLEGAESLREELEKQHELLKTQLARQAAVRDEAANAQTELRAEEEKLRLEVDLWEKKEGAAAKGDGEREEQLQQLTAQLQVAETKLTDELRPSLEATQKKYQETQERLQKAQQRLTTLQCRRGILAARLGGEATSCDARRDSSRKRKPTGPAGGAKETPFCSDADVQREIQQAEHLGKEETEMIKTFKAKIEALTHERTELEAERDASQQAQARAGQELRETEAAQRELSKAFEEALEELRTQQAQLGELLQEHTVAKDALESSEDRFWHQFRTDVREGLQAALAFARSRGWAGRPPEDSPQEASHAPGSGPSAGENSGEETSALPVPAGMLLDFIDVASEYRRAVEAVAAHALTAFVVPDTRAAEELLTFLKNRKTRSCASSLFGRRSRDNEGDERRREEKGLSDGKPSVSITVVPLKEVAQVQRQKEEQARSKARRKWIRTLAEEGKCMPVVECVDIQFPSSSSASCSDDEPRGDGPTELVSAYLRSVLGRAVLVPSLAATDDGLVPSLHDKGLDCVTVDGDVAFASGVVRGGGVLAPFLASAPEDNHGRDLWSSQPPCGKLQAYRNLRQRKDQLERLARQIEEKRKRVAEVEGRHDAFIEREQILCEARARCHATLEEAVASRQQAESRLRATQGLLAAVEEGARQASQRVHGIKTLIQNLRRESVSPDTTSGLSAAEEQEAARLPAEIRALEKEMALLKDEAEHKERAVREASSEIDFHLRKQIERLERESARGRTSEAQERRKEVEEQLAAVSRRMLQEEEVGRKCGRRLRILEEELEEKEGELTLAEKQRQGIVAQIDDALKSLQMSKRAAESAQRAKDDAEALLATTGAAAAAAPDVADLRLVSSRELTSKLSAVKKKLEAYSHVNRRAVDQFANLQDDFTALQQRESRQRDTQDAIREQLHILVRRKKKAVLASFHRVNEEFQKIFSTLVPGGRAEMVSLCVLPPGVGILPQILQHALLPDSNSGCFEDDATSRKARDEKNGQAVGAPSRARRSADSQGGEGNRQARGGRESGDEVESSKARKGEDERQDDEAGSSLIGVDIRAAFSDAGVLAASSTRSDLDAKGKRRLAHENGDGRREKDGRTHGVNQLSGGQKSLVSLALLLALQRVSCCLSTSTSSDASDEDIKETPGGVLLLDEVDAALDESHRRAAAQALAQTARRRISQVILTTFRPELLSPADSLFHISQENRVSYVEEIDLRAAMEILQEHQGEEMALHDDARSRMDRENARLRGPPLAFPALPAH